MKVLRDLFTRSTARDPGPLARWTIESRPTEIFTGGCGTTRVGLPNEAIGPYVMLYLEIRDRRYSVKLPSAEALALGEELTRLGQISNPRDK